MPPVGKLEASGSAWISSLPEKLGERCALARGGVEAVVLLGGQAGERLEHVGVVGRALLERPLLHRQRHGVGQRGVERLAPGQRLGELLVDLLGEALALNYLAEDVLAEDLVVGDREVRRAQCAPVRGPLCCEHVLLTDSGHLFVCSFLSASRRRRRAWLSGRGGTRPLQAIRPVPSGHYPNVQSAACSRCWGRAWLCGARRALAGLGCVSTLCRFWAWEGWWVHSRAR